MFRLEYNVKIDDGACVRVSKSLPVMWDSVPGVLYANVIPRWLEGLCSAVEGSGGQDKEHEELAPAHDWIQLTGMKKAEVQ